MTCPTCGGADLEAGKHPILTRGLTIRQHRCKGCGERFASVQAALTGAAALRIAEALATAMTGMTSSLRPHSAPGSSAREGAD